MKKKLVVIGSGPAGHTAALEAAKQGMEVVLVEEGQLGGVCLNSGCIPTKICLSAIRAGQQASLTGETGVRSRIELWKKRQEDVIERLRYGVGFLADRGGIRIAEGRAAILRERQVQIETVSGEKETISCDAVLIATGSEEKSFPLPADFRVHSIEELALLRKLPEKISILGAGALGTELAVILRELGLTVHLLEKDSGILPGWDEEIRSQMSLYLKGRGIDVQTARTEPLSADVVFCCGRKPVLPTMAEEISAQLNWKDGVLQADANGYIGSAWVYAAGDCVNPRKEANTAMEQGKRAVQLITGTLPFEAGTFPPARCIYTPLEAASAGRTKEELEAMGIACAELFYPIVQTASGMMEGLEQGFIKAIMEKDSHVLAGFHLMAPHASEMIIACQIAVECRMTAEKFVSFLFPHPTEGELLKEAVLGLLERLK